MEDENEDSPPSKEGLPPTKDAKDCVWVHVRRGVHSRVIVREVPKERLPFTFANQQESPTCSESTCAMWSKPLSPVLPEFKRMLPSWPTPVSIPTPLAPGTSPIGSINGKPSTSATASWAPQSNGESGKIPPSPSLVSQISKLSVSQPPNQQPLSLKPSMVVPGKSNPTLKKA